MIFSFRAVPVAALLALLPAAALVSASAAPVADTATDPQAKPAAPQMVGDGVHQPKLELRHWGSPRLLRNPVALWVNDQGVVYTAETERAGNGRAVLDTRFTGHIPNNILVDVGLLSVDDRIAQEKAWEAKNYYPKGRFTATADFVRAIEDTNGDGVADASHVLAKFSDYGDGINSGVMELDGWVYATCIPHLWKIAKAPGANGAYAKESLSYGWGVRLAFYGHDMHGLCQGPDGRIYFSIGDRGFNVKTKEGVHYDMLGEGKGYDAKLDPKHVQGHCRGGVFRCWPDGTGMEMVFEGLRNPQGLAFNDLGELFTGDNNSDIGGDPARFDYLPEYGDGGWRQDVQTFDKPIPNGAGLPDGTGDAWKRAVWLREKMPFVRNGKSAPADPHDPTTPAWQIPPMMNLGNGPSGMAHMPGTGHDKAFDDCLLMVNYGPQLFAVKATTQGAWYKGEAKEYFRSDRMTDIKWGPDGQLYVSLFGSAWTPGDSGEVLALRDPKVFADPAEKAAIDEVKKLLGEGMAGRKVEELLGLLGHRDQRVRQRAQSELAKQEGGGVQVQALAGDTAKPVKARLHAVWTLWQKAGYAKAHGTRPAFDLATLEPLLADANADVRVQAARVLGDLRHGAPATYVKAMQDADARVRFYAAVAVGKTGLQSGDKAAVPALLAVLKDAGGVDPVLRHGASWALAQLFYGSDGAELVKAASGAGVDERVGVVLALRRLRSPLVAKFLTDEHEQVAAEAARAIYDMEIAPAYPALADMLGRLKLGTKKEAFLRRAIEAASVCGRSSDARGLARVACDDGVPLPLRRFALECLHDWSQPVLRERVWGHIVARPGNAPKLAQDEVEKSAGALLAAAAKHKDLSEVVGKIMGRHLPPMTPDQIISKVADASLDSAYRGAMLERLAREAKDRVPPVAAQLLADATEVKDAGLRIRTRELLASADPVAGMDAWFKAAGSGELSERQAAIRSLGALPLPEAQAEIAWLWHKFETGAMDPALGLDLLHAAKMSTDGAVAAKAKAYEAANLTRPGMEGVPERKPHFLLVSGGDSERGEHAFRDPANGKACSECHNAGGPGSNSFDATHEVIFPNLGQVGLLAEGKDPLFLARAILDPNADIAEGFKAPSAMYEKYAHDLSAEDVRNLVAYLKTLKGEPAKAAAHAHDHVAPHGADLEGASIRKMLIVVFGLLAAAMAVTGVLSLIAERNKAKLG